MGQQTQKRNHTRQQFLLTFFPDASKTYEEKEVNGFYLVKHIVNGDPTNFEVAIYTKDAFSKANDWKQRRPYPWEEDILPDNETKPELLGSTLKKPTRSS